MSDPHHTINRLKPDHAETCQCTECVPSLRQFIENNVTKSPDPHMQKLGKLLTDFLDVERHSEETDGRQA